MSFKEITWFVLHAWSEEKGTFAKFEDAERAFHRLSTDDKAYIGDPHRKWGMWIEQKRGWVLTT